MFKSRMVACGTVEEIGRSILGEREGTMKIAFEDPSKIDEQALADVKGLSACRRVDNVIVANFEESKRSEIVREIVARGCLPIEVRGTEYSLEEIYLRYFREV